ncbi:hypothetical protein [Helicobacter rodentium]|nr:hypothetical protein [Helicobacter rodentium]
MRNLTFKIPLWRFALCQVVDNHESINSHNDNGKLFILAIEFYFLEL